MKVLIINSVCGIGSTGKIVVDLAKNFIENGDECVIAYGREKAPKEYDNFSRRIGNDLTVRINGIKARLFDNEGFNAKLETKQFLKWADEYNPDLVWLHNLHGYYINVELLFNWIKSKPNLKVKWTLHDCWAFTGHCTHFAYVRCDKWKKGCSMCVQNNQYPKSILLDKSKTNYVKKKRIFSNIKNLEIIVPTNWLKRICNESFLKKYSIFVRHNRIDESIFYKGDSTFKKDNCIENKIMILGVSNVWNKRKGFDTFIKLEKMLDDKYKIVMVGLNRKQLLSIPKSIIGIGRVGLDELANIYRAADIFINASVEETYGMTVAEAQSCGAKVIVIKGTACEEIVSREKSSIVRNLEEMLKEIILYE